jgi:hypothetical protein
MAYTENVHQQLWVSVCLLSAFPFPSLFVFI